MKDPIGIYENLKEQYFKYIDTAFSVDDPVFKTKRREEYLPEGKDVNNVLAQEPYLELIKPYPSSGKKISELLLNDFCKDDGSNYFSNQDELELFREFCLSGLVGDFPLYQHQIEMIQNYALGKNCIITTGTGSGKTESFLLPLFAYLAKQISKWRQIPEGNLEYNWFSSKPIPNPRGGLTANYEAKAQRENSVRNSSIKAIILYPMNALVDDQMTRLRKALDSEKAEDFYKNQCNNHRVYFGQYNGATPISSDINEGTNTKKQKKHNELREKVNEIQLYWNKIQNIIDNGNLSVEQVEDLIYTAQKVGGSELLTRFDMQKTPPDIFITNYSMLNIMLMRNIEDNVFTKTKEWLKEDTKNNIFHLIVDELHLNRGSSGTELALLLRLVEYRLGLYPGHPQLRILASSASLDPNDEDSKKYITDFFGMDFNNYFKIIKEERATENLDGDIISKNLLENFYTESEKDNQGKTDEELVNEIFGNDFLFTKINQVKNTILKGFENNESKHTFSLSDVNANLFGEDSDYTALKGLLKLRAIYDDKEYKDVKGNLPRIRFHLFFKNVDDLHTVAGEKNKLILNSSSTKVDGKKVFQNLYCDECGTLFYGGRRFNSNGKLEMLPISREFENMPDLNLDKRPEYLNYSEFIIFWPCEMLGKTLNSESATFNEVNGLEGIWDKALLNIKKGTISFDSNNRGKDEYISGYIYKVNREREETKSLPCQCPQCAQSYIHKKFMKSPVRTFRTGYSQVTQVLASTLLKQLSPEEVDNRKLLIFSDSRSAAADLANKLERNNYSDVLRKNVFRLGLIDNNEIRTEVDNFFATRNEEEWNWLNLSNEVQDFCQINFPTRISDLKIEEGIFFKRILIERCFNSMVTANSKTIPIRNLMPTRDNPGLLFKEFLVRGINPVGNDYSFQKSKDGRGLLNWHEIFNLNNGQFDDVNIEGPEGSEFYPKLQSEFNEQICNVLFGRHQFAIETMAKGYITFPNNQLELIFTQLRNSGFILTESIQKTLKELIDSLIRILGYKFRHVGSTYAPRNNYSNFTSFQDLRVSSAYRKFIDKVFEIKSELETIQKERVVNIFLSTLNTFNPPRQFHNGIFQPYIDPTYFDITHLSPDDRVYKCSNCGANHGHFSAGVCAHCFEPLDINNPLTANEIWNKNFYANSEEPIRMHTEELTGQTDASDAKNRQKSFKNIFLDRNANSSSKKAEQIDVLSVTTTMEVGVDIGSLEATMMANMPPERYNYQQRVGRAGRGGQAFSIALTLCRGNSHDSYYYSNLDGMVNAKPPTPFIPMEQNSDISKRIFYKEILRDVFRQKGTTNKLLSIDPPEDFQDTHGEFGSYDDFVNELSITKTEFVDMVNSVLAKEEIKELSQYLNFSNDFYDINFEGKIIFQEIIEKLHALEIRPIGLAECLAEAGLLPMYGMPTRTRTLHHDYKNGEFSSMSRDLEMAISEYAPGNEITKDKKIFKVEAITSPITKRKNLTQYNVLPIDDNVFYYQNNEDGTIGIEKDSLIQQFENEEWPEIIDSKRKIAVIPKAYITKMYPEENSSALKPYFAVSIPRILNTENSGFVKNGIFNNLESFFHQGHIISFNEGENGDGFNFGKPSQIFRNNDDLLKTVHISRRELDNMDDSDSVLKYSLAANKYTSLLQIKPAGLNTSLQLSCEQMNDQQAGYELNNFSLQGVKSAIYSAAFLLRSVFTQQQDVDNSELEVLGLRHYSNEHGNRITGFSFADQLSNGSGFSQKLSERLTDYINLCLDPTGNFNGETVQFVVDLLSVKNQRNCDVADYTNLLNYRNKRFHPLLNWRLAVSYLRILRGDEAEIEKITKADSSLPEFGYFYGQETWLKGIGVQLNEFKEEYGINSELITDCQLPFLQCNAPYENKIIIPYHPLWNKDTLSENPLIKEILDPLDNEEIIYIDSFNLANRPGECYEKLVKGWRNQPNWDALN
jgi:DEAD/DEAH box helicase domain-containing protein